jgi:aspartate aminotransferase
MKVATDAAKLRARGRDIVDLGPGEPDFPTPDNIKRAAIRAIQEDFTRYTAAGGTQELREAVCERHAMDFGTSYTPSECVICAGGKHALFGTLQCLIDPGDEVIIPVPYWVTFTDVVTYCGGKPVLVATDPASGFDITAELIERRITKQTRAVIVNSPCNPSGAVVEAEEFERLYDLTSKRGIWLITDECYSQLVYDGAPYSVAGVPGSRSSVIVAGSLSKSYAMTGWRIGYVLGPPRVVAAVARLQSHSTSNPNSVAQKAAVEALKGDQEFIGEMVAEYRHRRDMALEQLRAIPGLKCGEPKGAFYLFPDVSAFLGGKGMYSAEQLAERLLEEAGVAVVPGTAFGVEGHLRITFAVSRRELMKGIARLRQYLLDLKQ